MYDLSNSRLQSPDGGGGGETGVVRNEDFWAELCRTVHVELIAEGVKFITAFIDDKTVLSDQRREAITSFFSDGGHLIPERFIDSGGKTFRKLNYEALLMVAGLLQRT